MSTESDPLEPLLAALTELQRSVDGLRITFREDLLALRNDMNRGFDSVRGEMERRFGQVLDAVADHVQAHHGEP